MTTPVVLDASAGVEILLLSRTGRRLLAKLPQDTEEWVLALYFAEVAAVLRRERSTLGTRWPDAAVGRLLTAPVRRIGVRPLLREAWSMRENVTVADAVYIVIARQLAASLATTDLRLAATRRLTVSTVVP